MVVKNMDDLLIKKSTKERAPIFCENKKEPKKRGRKPGRVHQTPRDEKKNVKIEEDKCVIAHLPIKLNSIQNNDDGKIGVSDFETDFESVQQDDEESVHSDDSDITKDVFVNGNKSDVFVNVGDYQKKIKELSNTVEHLMRRLKSYDNCQSRHIMKNSVNLSVVKCKLPDLSFEQNHGSKPTIDTTNISTTKVTTTSTFKCWHCANHFENEPFGLPEKYYGETFYVFGNFCSLNCALKYNHDLHDHKVDDRSSLLYRMYAMMYENPSDVIIPAPPRETLIEFGGCYTIEEFRNITNIMNKHVRMIMPPMLSIQPLIEEDYRYKNIQKMSQKNVPINADNLATANKNLRLKREKPLLNAKYSLEKTMGIKRKTSII